MDVHTTVRLRTGNQMPILGLGTWQLTRDTAGTVQQALEMEYPMIDTAADYGTQPAIGEAILRSGTQPQNVFVVTKVEENEDSYDGTVRDLDELGLDYVDLILIHRPPGRSPGQELWEGLIRAREDGLTRDIGVSNYSVDQLDELIDTTGEVPVVNQIEWTPFGWNGEMLDYCRDQDIVIQAYSPLTRGERLDDRRLSKIAASYAKTPAQLIIRWDLQLGVVPLPKANDPDHLTENLDVFDFEISDEHMEEVNRLNEHWSALGQSPMYE